MHILLSFFTVLFVSHPALANEKDSYEARMKQNIESIQNNIADLKKDATEATGKARDELMKRIGALEVRRDDMKARLDRMEVASGKAWVQMKQGLNSAWAELKRAYKNAEREVREARNEDAYEVNDDSQQQKR